MSCLQNTQYKSNADLNLKTENFRIDKTENKDSKSIKQYIPNHRKVDHKKKANRNEAK